LNNKKQHDSEFVNATDALTKPKTTRPNLEIGTFEKLIKALCPNHSFPIMHVLQDCDLMKGYLKGEFKHVVKE
jgi:hypothetical protein